MIFSDSRVQLGIKTLVDEKKISLESLEKITRISGHDINNFMNGKEIDISLDKSTYLAELYDLLTDGMSMIKDDERLKSIIEVLVVHHKLNIESIALCTNLPRNNIEQFLEDPMGISAEDKYQMAIRILFLYYIFKFPNYQNI